MEKQRIHLIVYDLKMCFEGEPWYGISVMEKLNSIPWELVNTNKYGAKSIAVLVRHMMNWRIFAIRKLEGDVEYDLKIDGPNDWSVIRIDNEQEWNELKKNLIRTQVELLEILSKSSDELLSKTVPGKKYTFGKILPSISQHDIYHLGQIAMLDAMERT